jgi:hypothetical protein
MARIGRIALAAALGAAAWLAPAVAGLAPPSARAQAPAAARDGWRKEFEEVCAKTQDAMVLTATELRSLVDRCDRLKPQVEALGESERKVYSRRLSACRNLYAYVLESKQAP